MHTESVRLTFDRLSWAVAVATTRDMGRSVIVFQFRGFFVDYFVPTGLNSRIFKGSVLGVDRRSRTCEQKITSGRSPLYLITFITLLM